jgi:NAD-dependent SIR2 family protein deacetylase
MRMRPTLTWTPVGEPLPRTRSLDPVLPLLEAGGMVALTGAGISTESGIPDYRGASGTLRRHTPMTYQEFTGSEAARQRYWARSHLGWHTVNHARPNGGHHALAALARAGRIDGVITQNVDGLHHAAGTPQVVELHGSLGRVVCLDCGRTSERAALDARLRAANPGFTAEVRRVNPDGDAEIPPEVVARFRPVDCADCGGGTLKPDVVFFGENVPRPRVDECHRLVDACASLLVLGSSLTVLSGLRFVRRAAEQGKPVVIVNQGPTRGDDRAAHRIDRPLGEALTELVERLGVVPV